MKIQNIAFCSNSSSFWDEELVNLNYTKKYPGASWLPYLAKYLDKLEINLISGKKALEKNILPEKILVIQELNSRHGRELINRGSTPFLIMSGESKLYAYYYYDFFNFLSRKFKFKLTFFDKNYKFEYFKFPSFSYKNLEYNNNEWDKRNFSILVVANKSHISSYPEGSLKIKLKWFILFFYKMISPSFIQAKSNILHHKRFEIIEFFGEKDELKLFGSNWDNSKIFPKYKKEKLTHIIKKLNPTIIDDKIEALKNYKFCFCIENTKIDGYITEKIIESIYAGCIPVYFGASDIKKYIPENVFIEGSKFKKLDDLYYYMINLSQVNAKKIIQNGFNFLASDEGRKYSYEGFAENIFKKVKECL